jgi:flagellar L-ring protein precursor FlgH
LHSLSGVCHKDAVGPGNVILSKDIASLEVTKEELGHIRDSYERGWLQKWWDRMKAF